MLEEHNEGVMVFLRAQNKVVCVCERERERERERETERGD